MRVPEPSTLPSVQTLHRATLGALFGVALLGVSVVLPAETGRDPTGVGERLGLTQLGALKQSEPVVPEVPPEYGFQTLTLPVALRPGQGIEVKALMRKGDQFVFRWASEEGPVFYDFHGEPAGTPGDAFTSYDKGTAREVDGTFEAPFDGVHGWYWKNTNPSPVAVELTVTGVYAHLGVH